MQLALVRAPHTSGYNTVDVREDAILTYLNGYLAPASNCSTDIFDFHLDRSCSFRALLSRDYDAYVLAVRETGANVHYTRRLALALAREKKAPVLLFGQTARLNHLRWPPGVRLVPHDESALASELGVHTRSPSYADGLLASPYIDDLPLSPSQLLRRRASLETSRGCHFGCSFCFINTGHNYPTRWQLRPVSAVLADIHAYAAKGIFDIVFHDSEFLGAREADFQRHIALLAAMRDEAPGTRFMCYSRADTLLRFGRFDLLRRGGLVKCFIGAESLADGDLVSFRKGLTTATILEATEALRGAGIHVHLNFMLFNKTTTVDTLRENIKNLRWLVRESTDFLGVPVFMFSFQAEWNTTTLHRLSDRTYLRWMSFKRSQPNHGVTYPPAFEPVIEVCRVVAYELACKAVAANLFRDEATEGQNSAIDRWFGELWPFCIDVLDREVSLFEEGLLTLHSLGAEIRHAVGLLENLCRLLPSEISGLSTREHALSVADSTFGGVPLVDHGWDSVIPIGDAGEEA